MLNFVAILNAIIYLQSKSLDSSSSSLLKSSLIIEKIQFTSYISLILTIVITFFVFCYEIFNSYEQLMQSRLTEDQKKSIPLSQIDKLQHDENNPDKPNYKPGYVLIYLLYYFIVILVIVLGVFAEKDQLNIYCEVLSSINFVYLMFIWKWKPYCMNANFHNKILLLNHSTSLIFLLICVFVKVIKIPNIAMGFILYFVYALLVTVGICGFIRIYVQNQFRRKMIEEKNALRFD